MSDTSIRFLLYRNRTQRQCVVTSHPFQFLVSPYTNAVGTAGETEDVIIEET